MPETVPAQNSRPPELRYRFRVDPHRNPELAHYLLAQMGERANNEFILLLLNAGMNALRSKLHIPEPPIHAAPPPDTPSVSTKIRPKASRSPASSPASPSPPPQSDQTPAPSPQTPPSPVHAAPTQVYVSQPKDSPPPPSASSSPSLYSPDLDESPIEQDTAGSSLLGRFISL